MTQRGSYFYEMAPQGLTQKRYVINRKGVREELSYDKILKRIQSLSDGLKVDTWLVTSETIKSLVIDIQTSDIDSISSQIAANYATEDPDYDKLAVKILVSNDHKEQKDNFVTQMKIFYENGQINKEFIDNVNEMSNKIEKILDHNRDYDYDIFGIKTLKKSYLLRTQINGVEYKERIQHMYMRFALALHKKDIKSVKETYNALSKKDVSCPTPQYCNAGTVRQQYASCFLLGTDDSIDGMYQTLKDVAMISKDMGGIGIHASNIRPRGSIIKTSGMQSTGLLRYLKVLDSASQHVTQGGRRSMSCAIYIEPWHEEFMDFLEMCLNNGQEKDRCRDLFSAVYINDIFMKRLKERIKTKKPVLWTFLNQIKYEKLQNLYGQEFEDYYIKNELLELQYCKQAGLKPKQIDIQDIFQSMIQSQVETGRPYIVFKDNVNKKCNQSFIGTIKSSNLCVSPKTMVLTSEGYYKIEDLKDKQVEVWNGKIFSKTIIRKTGENQKLLTINFNNGLSVKTTEYHNFHIEIGKQPYKNSVQKIVQANKLKANMKIIKCDYPVIKTFEQNLDSAYTNGLFCAEGTYLKNINEKCSAMIQIPKITLYGKKKKLLKYIDYLTYSFQEQSDKIEVMIKHQIKEKYYVPINYSLNSKLQWLSGYLDGDGCISKVGKNILIHANSTNQEFITNVVYMLQTVGIQSYIRILQDPHEEKEEQLVDGKEGQTKKQCKCEGEPPQNYRLNIVYNDFIKLLELGLDLKLLNITEVIQSQYEARRFVQVQSVIDNDEYDDTYCFSEPQENKGIFNGVIMGQCAEINIYSDKDQYGVCNLSSICLGRHVEYDSKKIPYVNFQKLDKSARLLVQNLNIVIDTSYYPVQQSKQSNMDYRPLGIGVQGLADAFIKMRLPFESDEALELQDKIFAQIYYSSMDESCNLVNKYGKYKDFQKSQLSKGIFQFDLWKKWRTQEADQILNLEPHKDFDWQKLKNRVIKEGVVNSLLLCQMPSASTSIITQQTEQIEPITQPIYCRKTKTGEFWNINKYMVQDLKELNMWDKQMFENIYNNESIQQIDGVPSDIKQLYKSVWEIKQKRLLLMNATRGKYICQSQSQNLFIKEPTIKIMQVAIIYAWDNGLKTGLYYMRTQPAHKTQKFTIKNDSESQQQQTEVPSQDDIVFLSCQKDCVSCSS